MSNITDLRPRWALPLACALAAALAFRAGLPADAGTPGMHVTSSTWSTGTGDDDRFQYSVVERVNGDGLSYSGSGGFEHLQRLTKRMTGPFVWFSDDGVEYVTRDEGVVARALEATAAVRTIGKAQGRLGAEQGRLGARQGRIGAQQGALGARLGVLGAREARLRSGDERAGIARERATIEQQMRELEEAGQPLAREQERLGRQQSALGERQRAASARAGEAMRELFRRAKQENKLERLRDSI